MPGHCVRPVCGWVQTAPTRRQTPLRTFTLLCLGYQEICGRNESYDNRLDPATLALLKRFDDLERLVAQLRPAEHLPSHDSDALPPSLDPPPSLQSDVNSGVANAGTRGTWPMMSIEAVLQWPPFKEMGFSSRLYPAHRGYDNKLPSDPMDRQAMVEMDLLAGQAVLANFFDNVHIFNPILDEEEVRNYVKMVQFEGIGWDSVSCLVVTTPKCPPTITAWLTRRLSFSFSPMAPSPPASLKTRARNLSSPPPFARRPRSTRPSRTSWQRRSGWGC